MMKKTYTDCPVEYTASLLGNRWKPLILRELLQDTRRYSELQKAIPGVSAKVLTENLRELEEDGIVLRKVYPVVPPKVEYSLSEKGEDLKGIIEAMKAFGNKYRTGKQERP